MKKIKVLLVTGAMNVGGIENQLMYLLRYSNKDLFQIDFLSPNPNAYFRKEIESLGSNFLIISEPTKRSFFIHCYELFRIMKDGNYDIVHTHHLFRNGLILFIAALAGIPVRISHAHTGGVGVDGMPHISKRLYYSLMQRIVVLFSTVQIACSEKAGALLYGNKALKRSTYHTVANSVETRKYLDFWGNNEIGEFSDDDWINVLHVGRVNPVKNQMFLTKIAEEFRNRGKKIRILYAGKGDWDYEVQVMNTIKEKGLDDYMKTLFIRNDVEVLMRKSKAFILPSLYQGMPLVMVEAQASGLPCIVSNTISKEVDFGLGTVQWLSLDDAPSTWADAIESAIHIPKPSKDEVMRVIKDRGFDAQMFSNNICSIYESSVNL